MTASPPEYIVPDCEICGAKGIAAFGRGAKHVCISCAMGWPNASVASISINGTPVQSDGITVTVLGPGGEVMAGSPPLITDEMRQRVLAGMFGDKLAGSYFLLGDHLQLMDVTALVNHTRETEQEREDLLVEAREQLRSGLRRILVEAETTEGVRRTALKNEMLRLTSLIQRITDSLGLVEE